MNNNNSNSNNNNITSILNNMNINNNIYDDIDKITYNLEHSCDVDINNVNIIIKNYKEVENSIKDNLVYLRFIEKNYSILNKKINNYVNETNLRLNRYIKYINFDINKDEKDIYNLISYIENMIHIIIGQNYKYKLDIKNKNYIGVYEYLKCIYKLDNSIMNIHNNDLKIFEMDDNLPIPNPKYL